MSNPIWTDEITSDGEHFIVTTMNAPFYRQLDDTGSRKLKATLVSAFHGPLSPFLDFKDEIILAGGWIRRHLMRTLDNTKHDADIFLTNGASAVELVDHLRKKFGDKCNAYQAGSGERWNALTLNSNNDTIHKYDLISFNRFIIDAPTEVIKSFDFTTVMCGITNRGKIIYHRNFYDDTEHLVLRSGSPEAKKYKTKALTRIAKFANEGFTLSESNARKLLKSFGIEETGRENKLESFKDIAYG